MVPLAHVRNVCKVICIVTFNKKNINCLPQILTNVLQFEDCVIPMPIVLTMMEVMNVLVILDTLEMEAHAWVHMLYTDMCIVYVYMKAFFNM